MSACEISLFDEPTPLDLNDLDGSPLDVFFATGIVNPFGPTLSVVAAAGEPSEGRELPVVEIMLNPFSQRVLQIGKMLVGSEWTPADDLKPLIQRDYGGCPTLVLASKQVTDGVRFDLATQILETHGDRVKGVTEAVKAHFGDPWTRVSEEMRGAEYDTDDRSIPEVARELTSLLLTSQHFKAEFQAFVAAWHGSIENMGLSDQMKVSAMGSEQFNEFFLTRVLPAVWVPEIEDEVSHPPAVKSPEKLELNSLEDVTTILESGEWQSFSEEKLVSLLRAVLFIYGQQGDTSYIKWLSGIYKSLLALGSDEDTRLMIESEMVSLVENDKVHPVVFLPFLVEDPSQQVASKAVIDFVSMSDYVNGELYAFTELRHLFENKSLANRGAVLGGLVAMGDSQSIQFATSLRGQVDSEEVRVAAKVHTPFPQSKAIQFWLQWAKELVQSRKDEDQRNFGSAASALILTLNQTSENQISEGDRNYPCHKSDRPILNMRTWSLEEYAKEIAADLYWIESKEDAPSLFSEVLRTWGLMPQAPVDKQFISGKASDNKRLKDLTPASSAKDGKGFLSRLFGGESED